LTLEVGITLEVNC